MNVLWFGKGGYCQILNPPSILHSTPPHNIPFSSHCPNTRRNSRADNRRGRKGASHRMTVFGKELLLQLRVPQNRYLSRHRKFLQSLSQFGGKRRHVDFTKRIPVERFGTTLRTIVHSGGVFATRTQIRLRKGVFVGRRVQVQSTEYREWNPYTDGVGGNSYHWTLSPVWTVFTESLSVSRSEGRRKERQLKASSSTRNITSSMKHFVV